MKVMKKIIPIMLAGILSIGLASCGGKDSSETSENSTGTSGNSTEISEPVTIEFTGWGDAAEIAIYQELVDEFMDQNPNITVVYRGESAATYMQTLRNRANNLPELFYMPDYDFLEWVANGMIKDVSSYLTEEELSNIWPEAIGEYYFNPDTMMLGKSEGAGLYGLPKDLGPFTLVYNKTLLDAKIAEYGLDSAAIYEMLNPADAMTWAEFRSLLKQIDPDGSADNVRGISHYELEAAVYSNNADFFNEDASEERITDPRFYEAVQFMADLTLVDNVMPTAADQIATNGYQRFKAQGCVFSFMGPWDCAEFWKSANFEFDIAPVPYNGENPEAQSTAWVGSMGYCVSEEANDKEVAAAMQLAKFLCFNEGAQREFYQLGQQVPNLIDMATGEYLAEDSLEGKSPKNRSVWIDTINGTSETDKIGGKVRSRYYTYSSDWLGGLMDWFASKEVWDGDVTAKEACEAYAETFQAYLDEMRANIM